MTAPGYGPQVGLILFMIASAGCGKSGGPQVAPVHGRVTLDGKPLPRGAVVFTVPGSSTSGGRTDENGNYELIFKRGVMGAPVGINQVTITADPRGTLQLPARYNEKSDLQREVKAGDNEFNFELTTEEKK